MSKIRTINQLQNVLDQEFAWRLKEVSTLKNTIRSSESIRKKTAVRAGITILYAHWEGFIKKSATVYLEFVGNQRLRYCDLKSCFIVFGLKGQLSKFIESKSAELSLHMLEAIRNDMNERAKLNMKSAIRTESNLSSVVFSNITKSIGIDPSKYEARYNLIDQSLLYRRNHIAHGEFIDVDPDGFRDLADEVIGILRMFKTDIENSVSQESYKETA